MQKIADIGEILPLFDGFFFDAYGVLVNERELLPGVSALFKRLKNKNLPHLVLSNGSARTLEKTIDKYRSLGLDLASDQVLTSGSILEQVLPDLFSPNTKIVVLGTRDSVELVEKAGMSVTHINQMNAIPEEVEVVVIANQTEFDFLSSVNAVVDWLWNALRDERSVKVVLSNPDYVYPRSGNSIGITAGSVASILEASISALLGISSENWLIRTGKPEPFLFREGKTRLGCKKPVMFGDQIVTDILGAKRSNMSAVLMTTGLVSEKFIVNFPKEHRPDYILDSFQGASC